MKTLKKVLKWLGIIVLFVVVLGVSLYLLYLRPFINKMKQTTVIKYDSALTIILGGGGNSGILTSDSLILVIDSKMDEAAVSFHDKVKALAGSRPILVVNTHYHPDHSKGNSLYSGETVVAGGNYTKEFWTKEASKETLPSVWLKDRMDLKLSTDSVTIFNLAWNAHTSSDVFVYLHKRKMLFGGDVILNRQAPALLGNGDPEGYLKALAWLPKQYDIQKIIPGHGAIGGIEVIDNFRQYFQDMKLAAEDGSKKDALVAKYKDWAQVPFFMSPGATISTINKKRKGNLER